MKKSILLFKGPAISPGASHAGWSAWFKKMGERLLDSGSGMKNGVILRGDGSTSHIASDSTLNGYSIVQAENMDDVISLVRDHPYLSLGGGEYSIEI